MNRRPSHWSRTFRPRLDQLESREVPATITVNTLADPIETLPISPGAPPTFAADGKLVSLREALESINLGQNLGDVTATGTYGQGDTIQFTGLAGTILYNPGNFAAGGPTPAGGYSIRKAVSLVGPGAGTLTVSGNDTASPTAGRHRVFDVTAAAGTVSLAGLTVADGMVNDQDGGGVRAANGVTLNLDGVTFTNNVAFASDNSTRADGGAVFVDGPLNVDGVLFQNNQAGNLGFAGNNISGNGGAVAFAEGSGGTFSTFTTVGPTRFVGNKAGTDGGGLYLAGAALNADGLVFDGNVANGLGGGLAAGTNLVSVSLRVPVPGATVGGTLFLSNATFTNNSGLGGGAALADVSGSISNSSFLGNTGSFSPATFSGGGGLAFYQTQPTNTTFTVRNSTFSGNTGSNFAGGILVERQTGLFLPVLNLESVTVVNNTASSPQNGGGAGLLAVPGSGGAPVRLVNTIVAGNTGGTSPNVSGPIVSLGTNLFTSPTPGSVASDVLEAAATPGKFPAPAANGGPTQTVALYGGSRALGGGNPAAANAPTLDQRGKSRPLTAGLYDIGAFQAQRPTAAGDGPFTFPFNGGTVAAPGVLANDTKTDVFPLTAVLVAPPPATAGSLVLNPNGSFTFTPINGFNGTASFVYQATDGVTSSPSVTNTFTVVVNPPVATADSFTTPFGQTLTVSAPGILANDKRGDGSGPLTATLFSLVSPSGAGTLTPAANGGFSFAPAAGFTGQAAFNYSVNDGLSTSASPATVTIIVTAALPPTAVDDAFTLPAGGGTIAAPGVLANDKAGSGGGLLTPVLVPSTPAGVTLTLFPDGSFNVLPAAGFPGGTVTFRYTVSDGSSSSGPATVTLTVSPPPPPTTPTVTTRFAAFGTGAGVRARVQVTRPGQSDLVLLPFEDTFLGGARVAVADLNRDGADDVVVTAGPGGGPRVIVYDGLTGRQIANFFAFESTFRGGAHVAAADSVLPNGTRTSLLVVGAGSFIDQAGSPRARAFRDMAGVPTDLASQSQGSADVDFFAYDPAFKGGVRVAAGDLDGDGTIELVTVAGPSGGADVRVWDTAVLSGTRPAQRQQFNGLGDATDVYRGGAFVAVSGGAILVTPDSTPDISNTELLAQSGILADTRGVARPGAIAASTTSRPPAIYAFLPTTPGSGRVNAIPLGFDLNEAGRPTFLGGVRVTAGATPGGAATVSVLIGYGPGGGGRVRQFVLNPAGGTSVEQVISRASETSSTPLGSLTDASVYVGLAPLPFPRSVASGGF